MRHCPGSVPLRCAMLPSAHMLLCCTVDEVGASEAIMEHLAVTPPTQDF